MKLIHSTALALILTASPAFAMKVTNLDTVAHTVELSGVGSPDRRVIQPNATENFTGASHGMLSLVTEQKPAETAKKGKKAAKKAEKRDSVVHADGLLSGIIGNERSENLPADPDNDYVIWSGGHLSLQSHKKNGGRAF